MAYLDWNKSEDDRIDQQVYQEVQKNPFNTGRRGVDSLWKRVEKDLKEQESLYSATREQAKEAGQVEQCIIVKS